MAIIEFAQLEYAFTFLIEQFKEERKKTLIVLNLLENETIN